jgi:hypothetical protein
MAANMAISPRETALEAPPIMCAPHTASSGTQGTRQHSNQVLLTARGEITDTHM